MISVQTGCCPLLNLSALNCIKSKHIQGIYRKFTRTSNFLNKEFYKSTASCCPILRQRNLFGRNQSAQQNHPRPLLRFVFQEGRIHDKSECTEDNVQPTINGNSLRDNVFTIPNALCVFRIVVSPLLAYLVIAEQFGLCCAIFAVAGITDMLDGFIARRFPSQKSALGSVLDPIADKVLVGTVYVALTYVNLIPVTLTALIVARDASLMAKGFWVRYTSLPEPKTLSRYCNPDVATTQIYPTISSKVNTTVQLCLVAATLCAPVFDYVDSIYLLYLRAYWVRQSHNQKRQCFGERSPSSGLKLTKHKHDCLTQYLTATTTVVSGVDYATKRNAYKVLPTTKKL